MEGRMHPGENSFDEQGYCGPCPLRGDGVHRYFFRLYAVNQELDYTGRVTRHQLMDELKGKTVDEAELMGRFTRG
jgi:phosphatidylethanolamine-binding protein (PEBP) family uncharacterized protein